MLCNVKQQQNTVQILYHDVIKGYNKGKSVLIERSTYKFTLWGKQRWAWHVSAIHFALLSVVITSKMKNNLQWVDHERRRPAILLQTWKEYVKL